MRRIPAPGRSFPAGVVLLVAMLGGPLASEDRPGSYGAPGGLSPDDWRQIQRVLADHGAGVRAPAGGSSPVFLQDATLRGRGDPGIGEYGAEAGYSVSVSGDTAIVGAWLSGSGLVPSGSAYVFVRSAGVWSLQQKLVPSNASGQDILPTFPTFHFGYSVAIESDTAVVGAPGDVANAAYVFTRTGTTWQQQQKLTPSQAPTTFFGGSVALSGDTVLVGAAGIAYMATYEGAAFVYVRSAAVWSEQQVLRASDGTPDAWFGASVSIDGDTAVVGAPHAVTAGGDLAGSAYVFVRAGGTWTEQQELTASDGAASDLFGTSVSVSGDTLGVGALGGDTPGVVDSGSAYVFVRSGTSWSEQQKLAASDAATNAGFGTSISLSGDTAAVGADYSTQGGIVGAGSAYVFVRSGATWSEQQKLLPLDVGQKHFGFSVCVDGNTLLAGAPIDTGPVGALYAGAAYVFTRSGSLWTQEQKLVGPDSTEGEQVGLVVSVSGDTAVVGAPYDSSLAGLRVGSAYVFIRAGTAWSEQQKISASDAGAEDHFGSAVGVSGDTLVVGAPQDDTAAGADAGSAYVFVRSGVTWSEQQKLTASDAAADARFGTAVALSGDTALVGAPELSGGPGAAYAFLRSGPAWSEQQKLVTADPGATDFGAAVAISADTALVGDDLAMLGTARPGAAFAFVRSGTVWSEQQKLMASDATSFASFGEAVSLSGDTAVVGAPATPTTPGAAYAFVRTGSVWSEQQRLAPADGVMGDLLGWSVSVSGDTALLGAPYVYTGTGQEHGKAYLFERSGSVWSEAQTLTSSDGAPGHRFGYSASLDGEIAVIGAPGANSAYVFRPHSADLAVTKSDGQTSATPGSQVTYSIVVANPGPDDVSGAGVTDALPSALTDATWTCVASPGSGCGQPAGSGGIAGSVDLLVGGSATYTLMASIDPAALGTLANSASVSVPAPLTDPNLANNSAQDLDTLAPEADLRLALTDLPDPAGAGGPLTYTVEVTNLGPSVSSGMTLSDLLPPDLGSIQITPGPPACNESGGTVACTLAGLSPEASHAVTVRGVVNAGALGSVISSAASVAGNETDPAAGNNSATELTAVGQKAEADLVHGSTRNGDLASAGGLPDEDLFRMNQQPYSSYEVAVDGTSADIGAGSGPALDRLASDATTVLQSALPIGAGASRSLRWENDSPASVSGEYLRVRSAGCTTTCDATAVYRIRAFDTTMLAPRFNNSGSQVTILLVQNISDAPVSGHARFWGASGALLASQALTLPPRTAFVLNSSTLPGAQGRSGSITVSHDGPYGALTGKTVAVEPATGFTFDTALLPRAR